MFLFLLALSPASAMAQEQMGQTSLTTLAASGTVDQVIDPRTLIFSGHKIVSLAGIDIPDLGHSPISPYNELAFKLVRDFVAGKTFNLIQPVSPEKKVNAFGQNMALVQDKKTGESVQEALILAGYARVWDGQQTGIDMAPLLAAEETARQAQKGIWRSNSAIKVFSADSIPPYAVGTLVLMNAQIQSVLMLDNQVIFGLSGQGAKGLHIRIPPEFRSALLRGGIDPEAMDQQIIRVRGYLHANGPAPYITVTAPWQIEMIGNNLTGIPVSGPAAALQ